MSLRDRANGRWPEIISAVLGEQYTNTRKHQPCPKGEGTDCYRFSDVDGSGRFFCRCSDGKSDGFDLIQCVQGCDFRTAAEQVESIVGKAEEAPKPKSEHWSLRLYREAETPPRSRYLESRGLSLDGADVRFHRSVPYYDETGAEVGRHPAMLAAIRRAGEAKPLGIHATYLDAGRKADVPSPRKILAESRLTGCSVPLWPASDLLGIAEGIETAMAARELFGVNVWAALNTALMKSVELPESVREVVIFADHDKNYAGHAAAYALAHRLTRKGLTVHIEMPDYLGDWNDALMDRENAA